MHVQTKAIVISTLKHQDKGLVVKCFTELYGLKSYYVRDAFSSKKNSQKNSYFRPLSLLEIICTNKNKGTLEYFKEIKISYPFTSVNTDFVKISLVFFISEVLHHCIREEEENRALYRFLEASLLWLDSNDEAANFHLILLLEITKFLGFYPDITNKQLPYFEMSGGVFTQSETITSLSHYKTGLLRRLTELTLESNVKAFHVTERQELLALLMDYYTYHLDGFKKPKSLDVLKEIFT